LRLAFLNTNLALDCLPRVIDIMAAELNWSADKKSKELRDSVEFLKTMGLKTQ
jgi:glycerol-3-phosphate dehydrogenase